MAQDLMIRFFFHLFVPSSYSRKILTLVRYFTKRILFFNFFSFIEMYWICFMICVTQPKRSVSVDNNMSIVRISKGGLTQLLLNRKMFKSWHNRRTVWTMNKQNSQKHMSSYRRPSIDILLLLKRLSTVSWFWKWNQCVKKVELQ